MRGTNPSVDFKSWIVCWCVCIGAGIGGKDGIRRQDTAMPGTQRESPKVRGIAGHIEQAERGAIRKSPQAHKHFCPLLPTAMVFVSYGFVLVQVQVQCLFMGLKKF